MSHKPVFTFVIAFSVSLSLLAMSFLPSGAIQPDLGNPQAKPDSSSISQDTPRQTQVLPASMPVFAIMPTMINPDIILGNAGRLNGVGATDVYTETSRGGLDHFFAFNSQNGNIVDEFNHTGGLFAVNFARAYTETNLLVNPTNAEVCRFLMDRQLFPAEIDPSFTNCGNNPPYMVKQIHLSTLDPGTGRGMTRTIGEEIQVPLAINIGTVAPNYIPMGGPGGHLSILLAGNAIMPSLDSLLPGLQALAFPWFGRMREPNPIGFYPTVPMQAAIQQFKDRFPEGTIINAGTPVMVYYLGFPDEPQDAVMPMWTFPDATAIISGTVVSLKDSALPGVEGFAPLVSISDPMDGEVIFRQQPVSLTFSITGDQGPFTYTVSADDTEVTSGVTNGGPLTLNLGPLPFSSERLGGHDIIVHAVNQYNIPGEDTVFLGAASESFLPLVTRSSPSTNRFSSSAFPASANAPASTLRIGIEWVMNYHNPELNLGQTQPDAQGLYTWLHLNGWSKSFNYGNDAAWEKDWRDCTLGGIDCTYGVDRAEFVYFSGHGSPVSWYFGVNKDYGGAWAGNARFQNVRWAAFSSCQTVRAGPYVGPGNPPLTDWFNSFKGSYMILGFHGVMGDIPFGGTLGFNLYNFMYTIFPWMQPSVSQAWVNTAFQMNAGKPAYLYAVGNFNPVNFKLPAPGSGPLAPLTGIYQFRWVWWDD
ncbi:MAG: DUF6345 domain-containing protein [Acidobacteriaceae bacterium]